MVSRYTLVETPALLPGEDWITKTTFGPFIDTGVDIPWERRGRMYLSVDTIREMAFEAGLFTGLIPAEREDEAYERGLRDGRKEGLSGNLGRLASQLRDAADALDSVHLDAEAPVEAASR